VFQGWSSELCFNRHLERLDLSSGRLRVSTCHGSNRPPEPNDLGEGNPKPLKTLVQDCRCQAEKFENRLLGPTILIFRDSTIWKWLVVLLAKFPAP
jgi:hypothetical protein